MDSTRTCVYPAVSLIKINVRPWLLNFRWSDARCASRKPRATRETGRYKARGGFWGSASVPGREDPRGMFALSKHWCTLWGTREMTPEGLVASVIVPDRTQALQRLFKSKHTQSLQSQAKRPPCFEIKLRNENLASSRISFLPSAQSWFFFVIAQFVLLSLYVWSIIFMIW